MLQNYICIVHISCKTGLNILCVRVLELAEHTETGAVLALVGELSLPLECQIQESPNSCKVDFRPQNKMEQRSFLFFVVSFQPQRSQILSSERHTLRASNGPLPLRCNAPRTCFGTHIFRQAHFLHRTLAYIHKRESKIFLCFFYLRSCASFHTLQKSSRCV